MIAFVKGTLTDIEKDSVVLEVGGFGMRVFTPISEELLRAGIGSEVKLYTYLNVREDAMILFGFMDKASLELFKLLIGVNGVGPKSALAIISTLGADDCMMAIASSDQKALSGVSGVGAKTASRIILDLKDKMGPLSGSISEAGERSGAAAVTGQAVQEKQLAIEALMALGFSQTEASRSVRTVYAPDLTVEEMVKAALKQLV